MLGVHEDTLIPLDNHDYKLAKDLKVGDCVVDNFGESTQVMNIVKATAKEFYRVRFEDGRLIVCAPHHLWETTDGVLQYTSELKKGQTIPLIKNKHGLVKAYFGTLDFFKESLFWDKGKPCFFASSLNKQNLISYHDFKDIVYFLGAICTIEDIRNKQGYVIDLKFTFKTNLKSGSDLSFAKILKNTKKEIKIKEVQLVPHPINTIAIGVKSKDHLYCCENYIVTHNHV